jgi:hypothetical protein
LAGFYGSPGPEIERALVRVPVPYEMHLYDTQELVRYVSVHRKLEHALMRVFVHVMDRYATHGERVEAGVTRFYGIYNPRRMRGGSRWSMHAYGAAIDLDASRNGLNTHWPTKAAMPIGVMECFAREGWLAAGAAWGRDAMHFQWTR